MALGSLEQLWDRRGGQGVIAGKKPTLLCTQGNQGPERSKDGAGVGSGYT